MDPNLFKKKKKEKKVNLIIFSTHGVKAVTRNSQNNHCLGINNLRFIPKPKFKAYVQKKKKKKKCFIY